MSAAEQMVFSSPVTPSNSPSVELVADQWRGDFRGLMGRLGDALKQAEKVNALLGAFASRCTFDLKPHKVIMKEVNCWVSSRIDEVNGYANNITHARVEMKHLCKEVVDFDYPRGMAPYERSIDQLLTYAVNYFPYALLAKNLFSLSAELEERGLREAADTIADRFDLFECDRWRQAKELNVKGVRGKFMLSSRHYGRNYERVERITRFMAIVGSFENYSGVSGLRDCLSVIRDAESNLGWNESIDSRTRFCGGADVEAVYFNEETKFYFSADVFDSLISFVKTHASKALRPLVKE